MAETRTTGSDHDRDERDGFCERGVEHMDDRERISPARGIIYGVALSLPLWAVIFTALRFWR